MRALFAIGDCHGTVNVHNRVMVWEPEFRKSLLNYFDLLKKRNHRLSIRAFAKKLEVSPGTMSEILRGSKRWKLTSDRALRILERMDLSSREKNYLKVLMGSNPAVAPSKPMAMDDAVLADWAYGPILMSYDVSPPWSIAEKARRFGLSEDKVRAVEADLVRRGLVEQAPDGSWRRVEGYWDVSHELPEALARKYQGDSLDLARQALETLSGGRREFTTLTFAGSREKIEILRREIRQLQQRAMALMDGQPGDEVYRLNVNLFPFDFPEKD